MFPFNLLNVLTLVLPKKAKTKYFEPLSQSKHKHYIPPSPGEIRKMTERMSRCSKCHFLIFDNYWTSDVEGVSIKICSTCGNKI